MIVGHWHSPTTLKRVAIDLRLSQSGGAAALPVFGQRFATTDCNRLRPPEARSCPPHCRCWLQASDLVLSRRASLRSRPSTDGNSAEPWPCKASCSDPQPLIMRQTERRDGGVKACAYKLGRMCTA
ncbi:hypothetical protein ACK3TF_000900 [Chlorella vulgaris]